MIETKNSGIIKLTLGSLYCNGFTLRCQHGWEIPENHWSFVAGKILELSAMFDDFRWLLEGLAMAHGFSRSLTWFICP